MYSLAWEYRSNTDMQLHDPEEAVQKRLWELEKYYHMILGWKRSHKTRRTLSGFLRIFMELCGSKVQLAPPHGIAISGFTNAEIIICCYVFKYFVLTDLYSLSLRENLLNFNGTYVVGSNHLKVFWKMDALSS